MKVVLLGAFPDSLLNFRGSLIKRILSKGHVVTAMASNDGGDVKETLQAIGAEFRDYPVQRSGLNPISDFKTWWSLRKIFRKVNPDVILAYTIKPIIWGGLACRVLPNVRFYALITGLGFAFQGATFRRKVLNKLVSSLYRQALKSAEMVVFQNIDNMHVFIELGIVPRSKCVVVNGSGVDTKLFQSTAIPEGKTTFLSIGRLLGEKGFREYAEAACKVKGLYPDARFQLLGPADPSPDGIGLDEIQYWHDQGWVEYLGSTDNVIPYLERCHVYVLPSYHEGMPRTVLEAMAMSRPILTTDVPGCCETVVNGVNGFLVPKADVQALVERMVWFLENRNCFESMGKFSREFAEDKFDSTIINQEMIKLMEL